MHADSPSFNQVPFQPLMPLLPLSSSDEGFMPDDIVEEEGRQSRIGLREEDQGSEEQWSYRSEDCLTYEDCLDHCLEEPVQVPGAERDVALNHVLAHSQATCSEKEGRDTKIQYSDINISQQHETGEAAFQPPTSPLTSPLGSQMKSESTQNMEQPHGTVQCSLVLVDKEVARRSPLNSAKPGNELFSGKPQSNDKPPTENFFVNSFRKAGGSNSLSAIGEAVTTSKDSIKKNQSPLKKEDTSESSKKKSGEQKTKVKNEEQQKKVKEEEQRKSSARKSRDIKPSKSEEISRKKEQEAAKGVKPRDLKTKSLSTDLLRNTGKCPPKVTTLVHRSTEKSLKKSESAPLVPLNALTKRKSSSSSSSPTIASESLASRAAHSSQERLRKLKKTMTTSREEAKPRPVTTPTTSIPNKRVHRTSSSSSSTSSKSSKSGSLTLSSSSSGSSKSGSLSLSSTPSPTSKGDRLLRDSKVASNSSKKSSSKTAPQHLITMKDDGGKKRQLTAISPPSKKKTPLVLEDTAVGKGPLKVGQFFKNVQTSNVIYFQRGSSPSPSTGSSSTTGTDLSSLLSLSRLSSLSSQRSLSSWFSSPIQTSTFCRSRSITDFSSLDRWWIITATIS